MNDRVISLDTETTGLSHKDGDRVIEIGAVEIVGNMETGRIFRAFINPGRRKVHPDAFAVHNISDEFLRDQPAAREVLPKFLEFVGDSPVVIHNAPFDMGFLQNELKMAKMPEMGQKVVDTLKLARELFPMSRNSLDALCTRFSVDRTQRTYHGALIDASLLAQVYISMMGLNRLDLGDRPFQQQMNAAVTTLIGSGVQRPVRHVRDPMMASEAELDSHAAFIDKEIKNSMWAKFF